jgi:hypothetical protein
MNSSYRMSAEWVAGSVELKDCSECSVMLTRGWCLNFTSGRPGLAKVFEKLLEYAKATEAYGSVAAWISLGSGPSTKAFSL